MSRSFLGGLVSGAMVVSGFGVAAIVAFAGPLDPPPGPVAPAYKTLGEVEPRVAVSSTNTPGDADSVYKITQPGSYYLTGKVTGVAGKHGIEITASGVTLDLMGYEIIGSPGSLDGVSATAANLGRIVVRNGSIRNWGDMGVDLATQLTFDCVVEDLALTSNGQFGLALRDSSIVQRCIASDNGGSGLAAWNSCTLVDCTVSYNGGSGISAESGAVVRQCAAYSNVGAGIEVGQASTITGCSSHSNFSWGYLAGNGCTITNSTASNNVDGFTAGAGSVVTGCTAESNGNTGFFIGGGGTIQQCAARNNGQTGIWLSFRCLALSNTSELNGGGGGGNSIGIFTASSSNRLEGNISTANHYGILVNGQHNILVRNACSGNTTNWSLGSDNVFGPIVDRRTPGSGSVSGNSAASTLGSTDPNANFSY
ncbi:MAG: hypothetical protein AMXMBFR58_17190 [Phycisphaerae bacterium]|nr:right-handed parallel beta-helix repeat-containing protein [Phycisphaerales bacterium]